MAQKPTHYTIADQGTFPGGKFSQALDVSDGGLAAGASTILLSATSPQHTVLWYNRGWYSGMITDLGRPGFGGTNSFAFGVNDSGQASGQAESSAKDPNNENSCAYGTGV